MQTKRKLKPSQVMSNYKDIPADPKMYVETSLMAKQPEVTLWDFIENRPDKEYEKWAKDIGSDLTTEYEAHPLSQLDINEQDFIDFMMDNKETVQKKYYEKRPYHNGVSELTMNLPMKCGYNARNTIEYNWGLYGDSNERVKELL